MKIGNVVKLKLKSKSTKMTVVGISCIANATTIECAWFMFHKLYRQKFKIDDLEIIG